MGGEAARVSCAYIFVISPPVGSIPDSDRATAEYEVLGSKHREVESCTDRLHGDEEFTSSDSKDTGLDTPDIIDRTTHDPLDCIDEKRGTLCECIAYRIRDDHIEPVFPIREVRELKYAGRTRDARRTHIGRCEISRIPGATSCIP